MEKTLYEACLLSDGSILRISASSSTSLMLVMGMLPMIFLVALLAAGLSALLAHRVAKRVVQPINQLDLEHPLENHVSR
jgi:two-component system phosphate regulon sensor histidine kinase PhoR